MFFQKKKKKPRKFKNLLDLPQLEKKAQPLFNKKYLLLIYILVSLFSLLLVCAFHRMSPVQLLGLGLIIFTVNLLFSITLFSFHPKLLNRGTSLLRYSLFLMALLVMAKILGSLVLPLKGYSSEMIFPIGLASVVISLGYSLSLGMITSLWLVFYIVFMHHSQMILNPASFFPLIVGGIGAVYIFHQIQTPVGLRRFGLLLGAIQAIAVGGIFLFQNPSWAKLSFEAKKGSLLYPLLWWFLNGLFTGWLLAEGLPFIEKAFGIITKFTLHKLAEQSHPLLNKLKLLASGTYYHSQRVGTLAEAAAEAIGANALLARVGSNFHDIGKMVKPDYYIENISKNKKNKHDSLSPSMSALIIMAHPRDGAEMAREYGLSQHIINFMEEHHGTTLVKYFYNKALKLAEESHEDVDNSSFRYPGPRPQTKETAIVALADPIEAASRTLADPTPTSIQKLIDGLVEDRIQDGQLDECQLTMEELRIIKETFTRILLSILHGRIAYEDEPPVVLDKKRDKNKTSVRTVAKEKEGKKENKNHS